MSIENVLIIIVLMSGIICGLVAIIYKILSSRIENITITHNELAINLSSIKTDLRWIKQKLEKI